MHSVFKPIALALSLALAAPATAESRTYGTVDLNGLARDMWAHTAPAVMLAMVCNVNGPDGYLSIRSGPGTNYEIRRNLKRLAILRVDTSQRRGHWVRVLTAWRETTPEGWPQAHRSLHVEGWAHDGYMCDFLY